IVYDGQHDSCYFFFQAEDGIRDATVTGVQTCALPIFTVTAAANRKNYDSTTSAAATPTITIGSVAGTDTASFSETYDSKHVGTRSEERRVGKECRYGWAADNEKKKAW